MTQEKALSSRQVSLNNLIKSAQSTVVETSGGGSGHALLKLNQADGSWVVGQDNSEVEPGDRFLIRAMESEHGFVRWKDAEPKHVMVKMTDQPDLSGVQANLPDPGEDSEGGDCKWEKNFKAELEGLTGTFKGETLVYQTNSAGGRDFFNKYMSTIIRKAEAPGQYVDMVVTLDSTSYVSKRKKKIYKPTFEVVEFRNLDGAVEPSGDIEVVDVEVVNDEEDGATGSEPAAEDAPPKRRRRRAAE